MYIDIDIYKVYSRCCMRICSAMVGVPRRSLLPPLDTSHPHASADTRNSKAQTRSLTACQPSGRDSSHSNLPSEPFSRKAGWPRTLSSQSPAVTPTNFTPPPPPPVPSETCPCTFHPSGWSRASALTPSNFSRWREVGVFAN